MSAHTLDKLVLMANQIARNVTHDPDPVGMIAEHIKAFWSPRMIAQIAPVVAGADQARLDPVAQAALSRLVGQDADNEGADAA
jgi:formate dehydrogenase subunit delta